MKQEQDGTDDEQEQEIERLQEEIRVLRELRAIDLALLEKLQTFMQGGRRQ